LATDELETAVTSWREGFELDDELKDGYSSEQAADVLRRDYLDSANEHRWSAAFHVAHVVSLLDEIDELKEAVAEDSGFQRDEDWANGYSEGVDAANAHHRDIIKHEIRDRMVRAVDELKEMAEYSTSASEIRRLYNKAEGLALGVAYVDELLR
jgi:hypothetical protein